MARKRKEQADPTVLAATTWGAIVEGWEIASRREVAQSSAPRRMSLNQKMRMTGGVHGAGPTVPRDPFTGLPVGGT